MASTSDENPTVVVDMEKVINGMQNKLRFFDRESERSDHEYTISRVFDSVRKEGKNDFEPQIISIGPIHRDKEALKPMEDLKWKYMRDLIHRNLEKNKLENYVNEIHSVEEKARKLYSESVKLDDDFVEMMVLDGCFLIEFLIKAHKGENQQRYLNELSQSQNLPLLRRDLLLLENQIPFLILDVLFKSSNIPQVSLIDLIADYVTLDSYSFRRQEPIDIVHLLHLYHLCLHPDKNTYHGFKFMICSGRHMPTDRLTMRKKMRRIGRLAAAPFLLLLSCLLTCKIPTNFCGYCHRMRKGLRAPAGEIPSAIQLYNSGVNFKEKTNAECLVDATFDKEEGILEIPMFSLQEVQISTFLNLIAFEHMYPRAGNHITSHAILMACLVRTPEDVAILRESGIIECMLKKDREVVEVFAQFLKGSYLSYKRYDNHKLFEEVLDYCSAVHHKWRADFKRTYFGNPWTVASLIAAILILLLTFTQTFYTIYVYHHPPL